VGSNQLSFLLTYPVFRKKTLMKMNLGVFTLSHFHLRMTSGVHPLMMLSEVCDVNSSLLFLKLETAPGQLVEAAEFWISKLSLKKDGGYPVDSYPNPGSVYYHLFSDTLPTSLQLLHTITCS
jgi:hypothetical protein